MHSLLGILSFPLTAPPPASTVSVSLKINELKTKKQKTKNKNKNKKKSKGDYDVVLVTSSYIITLGLICYFFAGNFLSHLTFWPGWFS